MNISEELCLFNVLYFKFILKVRQIPQPQAYVAPSVRQQYQQQAQPAQVSEKFILIFKKFY